jgi:GntR family transcriptional regulator, galactonate operon transcriptional repressor
MTDSAAPRAGLVRGLHGQTVDALGARIVQGRYAPGTYLQADAIEQELGISKSVLREAMRVLAAKGLVDSRQRRGTVVRPRSYWLLLDGDLLRWQSHEADAGFLDNLAEVRSIVEPAGARLAARRRTDDDLAALESALAAMAGAGTDAGAVIESDLAFHAALLDAAHNELLSRMEVVIGVGLRARDQLVHGQESWPDSLPVHWAIFEAVRAGDPVAAAAAMEALLEQASLDIGQIPDGEDGAGGGAQ